jgi:hypothetical protein
MKVLDWSEAVVHARGPDPPPAVRVASALLLSSAAGLLILALADLSIVGFVQMASGRPGPAGQQNPTGLLWLFAGTALIQLSLAGAMAAARRQLDRGDYTARTRVASLSAMSALCCGAASVLAVGLLQGNLVVSSRTARLVGTGETGLQLQDVVPSFVATTVLAAFGVVLASAIYAPALLALRDSSTYFRLAFVQQYRRSDASDGIAGSRPSLAVVGTRALADQSPEISTPREGRLRPPDPTAHDRPWRLWFLPVLALVAAAVVGGIGETLGDFLGGVIGALVGFLGSIALHMIITRHAERDATSADWQDIGRDVQATTWSEDLGYAALLRPEHDVISFTGRSNLLDGLHEWAHSAPTGAVLLATGPGGVGKTRLAMEFARQLMATGWRCRFVSDGAENRALPVPRSIAGGAPVLLVLDYAETRVDLAHFLQQALAARARVRVLLLARTAADWWRQLCTEVPRLASVAPLELAHQVDSVHSPDALARHAMLELAHYLGRPAPVSVTFILPPDKQPTMLTLHAAALVAVLEQTLAPQRIEVEGILRDLLRHEERYWTRTAWHFAPFKSDITVLRRATALSCLLPLPTSEDQTASMLQRVPDLSGPDEGTVRHIARWLTRLYPPKYVTPTGLGIDPSQRLSSLEPGILAEFHVCEELPRSDAFTDACLQNLTDEQAQHALTLLGRARSHHHEADRLFIRALQINPRLLDQAVQIAARIDIDLGRIIAYIVSVAPVPVETLSRLQTLRCPVAALDAPAIAAADRLRALDDAGGR